MGNLCCRPSALSRRQELHEGLLDGFGQADELSASHRSRFLSRRDQGRKERATEAALQILRDVLGLEPEPEQNLAPARRSPLRPRLAALPPAYAQHPSALARIRDGGGDVETVFLGDPDIGPDLAILAPLGPANDNRWCAFHTSCDRVGHAGLFFQRLAATLASSPEVAPFSIVLPFPGTDARHLRVVLDALYHRPARVTLDNCIEIASLIDCLGPLSDSPWNDLRRRCEDALASLPSGHDHILPLLRRLSGGGEALFPWARGIAETVATSPEAQNRCLRASPEQIRVLACAFGEAKVAPDFTFTFLRRWARTARPGQDLVKLMRGERLVEHIRWEMLSSEMLWAQDAAGLLTDVELGSILRRRHLAPDVVASPGVGRRDVHTGTLTTLASGRIFEARWCLSNVPELSKTEVRSPLFCPAPRTTMYLSLKERGLFIYIHDGLPARATMEVVLNQRNKTAAKVRLKGGGEGIWQTGTDLPKIEGAGICWGYGWTDFGMSKNDLLVNRSRWLNDANSLEIGVTLNIF